MPRQHSPYVHPPPTLGVLILSYDIVMLYNNSLLPMSVTGFNM